MALQIDWDRHDNLLIRDVHQKWHDRIRSFMLDNYFIPNPLFKVLHYQIEWGINENYARYLTHILNNECCVVALDEQTNEIYAVAMVMWMTKQWKSWTSLRLVMNSRKLNELITFQRYNVLNYAQQHPQHAFDSLHLFEYYISSELNGNVAFMDKFFNAICEVARHMNMPRVTFVAMSQEQQNHALDAGFVELEQIMYSLYVNKKGLRPFTWLRNIDEMYACLFEKPLAPLTPYYEMTVRHQEEPPPQPTAAQRA